MMNPNVVELRTSSTRTTGFAMPPKEDSKTKVSETKKEKAEDSEEIVARFVAVEDLATDRSDSDDWSDPEEVKGPITTDALKSPPSEQPPTQQRIRKKKRVKGPMGSRHLAVGVMGPSQLPKAPRAHRVKKVKKIKPKPRKYTAKAIGRTITKGDKSYELMFDMLLGIRISVSGVSAKKRTGEITRNDITEVDKYFVPSAGTIHTPAHPGRDFQFCDYAPKVFRDLREHHGIDSADYLISLTGDYVLSEIVSPGKSGSFFYFSHDTKYMLKTITPSEKRFFKKILRAYYQHVMDNPDTLVIRFYGFHMVQPHGGPKMHFVVMGNIFAQSLEIQERYDLKGSSIGRTAGDEKNRKPTTILKDLDLKRKLVLGPEKREILFNQMETDCEFLQRQDIMDYSLLLGIHRKAVAIRNNGEMPEEYEEDENQYHTIFTKDHGGFGATDESNEPLPEIYFMGIIDILQPYNISKQVEHTWKSNVMRMNKFEISAVSPTVYAERFLRFMRANTGTEEADLIRKELKRELRLLRRRQRMDRREARAIRKARRLERQTRRANGETVTEITEITEATTEISESTMATSIIEDQNSVESLKNERTEEDIVEENGKEENPKSRDLDEATQLQQAIASGSSVDSTTNGLFANSEPVLESPKKREDMKSTPGLCQLARTETKEEGSEVIEIEDDHVFEVRVPKRKRVKEKSRLDLHALAPRTHDSPEVPLDDV